MIMLALSKTPAGAGTPPGRGPTGWSRTVPECSDAERWRPVPGYTGYYEVSDLGRVRSVDRTVTDKRGRARRLRGVIHKPYLDRNGRPAVRLCIGRVYKCRQVHQLVLEAFIGARPAKMEACHNNGDKTDNRLINLRWDTRSQNIRDRVRHGTHQMRNRTHCPRGHLLAEPNIPEHYRKNGYRGCLACSRARSRQARAEERGKSFNFALEADITYVKIMSRREAS